MEICAGLPDGAPLVVNADNDLLSGAQAPARLRRVSFGIEAKADVRAEGISTGPNGTDFTIVDNQRGKFAAYIPAMGVHNVYDALSAWTLAVSLGLDAKKGGCGAGRLQNNGPPAEYRTVPRAHHDRRLL